MPPAAATDAPLRPLPAIDAARTLTEHFASVDAQTSLGNHTEALAACEVSIAW